MRIVGNEVEAPRGIRWASGGEWVTALPLKFDQPYLVRKADGSVYRLWMHDQSAQVPTVTAGTLKGAGRYALSQIAGQTVRGARASPNLLRAAGIDEGSPELVLATDGTYQMGSARGRWHQAGGKVWLEGDFGEWGAGQPSADGNSVTFLLRGNVNAFIVLRRQDA